MVPTRRDVAPDAGERRLTDRFGATWPRTRLLERILEQAEIADADQVLFAFMLFNGLDPNVHRTRLLDRWTRLLED